MPSSWVKGQRKCFMPGDEKQNKQKNALAAFQGQIPVWNECSNGTAIWLVNKKQPASNAAQGLGITFHSGGTSTPLLGDSLSGPHSHPAGWACLFSAAAAAAASSSSSARIRSSPFPSCVQVVVCLHFSLHASKNQIERCSYM